jgi:hypothetical protein
MTTGRFRHLVNDLYLKVVPLLGRRYTWSNECEAPTLIKLDQVLCTTYWEELYPDSILRVFGQNLQGSKKQ